MVLETSRSPRSVITAAVAGASGRKISGKEWVGYAGKVERAVQGCATRDLLRLHILEVPIMIAVELRGGVPTAAWVVVLVAKATRPAQQRRDRGTRACRLHVRVEHIRCIE